MVLNDEFVLANRRAADIQEHEPRALAARYDRASRRIKVQLSSGVEIAFAPQSLQGLESAKPSQLSVIEISPSGLGIHFPKLDADLYLPALLAGFLGSKKWAAARLGATGGRSSSAAKVAAARRNGRLGGRPRKASAGR
jgi:hypothetical protein